jgi:hypothetical protein
VNEQMNERATLVKIIFIFIFNVVPRRFPATLKPLPLLGGIDKRAKKHFLTLISAIKT